MVVGRPIIEQEAARFWARFGTVEHEALEFKASARNLREVIPAMAMTHGGTVVLGVADDRRLVGCPLDQPALDAIMRRAREAGVDVRVTPILVGGVPLTLVKVPRVTDRIVTTADGRILRRVGGDNVPVCGDEVARFVAQRRRPWRRLTPVVAQRRRPWRPLARFVAQRRRPWPRPSAWRHVLRTLGP